MNQKEEIPEQVLYLNRWVDKKTFCAFVYSKDAEKLASSYQEFEDLLASGAWFASKEDAEKVIVAVKKPNAIKRNLNIVKDSAAEPAKLAEVQTE